MAWQMFPRANYVIVWWRKNDNWGRGYVLAGDWEWEGIQRMGSQRGTDSSLTGKLRNQIGLLSRSLFLQPGKDLLGCTNIVLWFLPKLSRIWAVGCWCHIQTFSLCGCPTQPISAKHFQKHTRKRAQRNSYLSIHQNCKRGEGNTIMMLWLQLRW